MKVYNEKSDKPISNLLLNIIEEMRNKKVSPELIEEANTYYETDDQEILEARKQFKKLVDKFLCIFGFKE